MKKLAIVLIFVAFTLGACVPQPTTPAVDYPATIAAFVVNATIGAMEKTSLQATLGAYQSATQCPVCPPTPTPAPSPSATPAQPTATPEPSAPPTGSISGSLGYPSSHIPPLRIVAYRFTTGHYWWQHTVLNQATYRFDDLPVGRYYVLAYLIENPSDNLIGGYSQMVPCGLKASCTDHSLIEVEVKAGQETQNVNPIDWYAITPADYGWPMDPTQP